MVRERARRNDDLGAASASLLPNYSSAAEEKRREHNEPEKGYVRNRLEDCAIALHECHFLFCCVKDSWPAHRANSLGSVITKLEVILTQCNGTINMLGTYT